MSEKEKQQLETQRREAAPPKKEEVKVESTKVELAPEKPKPAAVEVKPKHNPAGA
mgnify:CR=1 FL=1